MASFARGPLTRTTAIAAGGRPDDNAKMVSRVVDMDDRAPIEMVMGLSGLRARIKNRWNEPCE